MSARVSYRVLGALPPSSAGRLPRSIWGKMKAGGVSC